MNGTPDSALLMSSMMLSLQAVECCKQYTQGICHWGSWLCGWDYSGLAAGWTAARP